jgi:hypothetical protein
VGLLLPLPIPKMVWADVTPNFIEMLPKDGSKLIILTVVDRLSKLPHHPIPKQLRLLPRYSSPRLFARIAS